MINQINRDLNGEFPAIRQDFEPKGDIHFFEYGCFFFRSNTARPKKNCVLKRLRTRRFEVTPSSPAV